MFTSGCNISSKLGHFRKHCVKEDVTYMTSLKMSPTVLRIFKPSLMHNFDGFLSDAWSGKFVSCILWKLTLQFSPDLGFS